MSSGELMSKSQDSMRRLNVSHEGPEGETEGGRETQQRDQERRIPGPTRRLQTVSARSNTLKALHAHLKGLKSQNKGQKAQFLRAVPIGQAVRTLRNIDDNMWVASRDGSIHVRDNITGDLHATIAASKHVDSKIQQKFFVNAILRRGVEVWTGSSEGFLHHWKMVNQHEDGPTEYSFQGKSSIHGGGVLCGEITEEHYWTGGQDSQIVQDGDLNKKLLGHTGWVRSMVYDADLEELWSCADDGIRIWEVPVQESISDVVAFIPKKSLAIKPGGLESKSGIRPPSSPSHHHASTSAEALCLIRVGEYAMWCGCSDGTIVVLDRRTKAIVKKVHAHPSKRPVSCLSVVGSSVWAGGARDCVTIWDPADCKSAGKIGVPQGTVTCISFSASRVWVGSRAGKCYLYRIFRIDGSPLRLRREAARATTRAASSSPHPTSRRYVKSPRRRGSFNSSSSSSVRRKSTRSAVKLLPKGVMTSRRGSLTDMVRMQDPNRAKVKYRHKETQTDPWQCPNYTRMFEDLKLLQAKLDKSLDRAKKGDEAVKTLEAVRAENSKLKQTIQDNERQMDKNAMEILNLEDTAEANARKLKSLESQLRDKAAATSIEHKKADIEKKSMKEKHAKALKDMEERLRTEWEERERQHQREKEESRLAAEQDKKQIAQKNRDEQRAITKTMEEKMAEQEARFQAEIARLRSQLDAQRKEKEEEIARINAKAKVDAEKARLKAEEKVKLMKEQQQKPRAAAFQCTPEQARRLRVIGEYASIALKTRIAWSDPTIVLTSLAQAKLLAALVEDINGDFIDVRALSKVVDDGTLLKEFCSPPSSSSSETKAAIYQNATLLVESMGAAGLETPDLDLALMSECMGNTASSSIDMWIDLGWTVCSHHLQRFLRNDTSYRRRFFWSKLPGGSGHMQTSEALETWVCWRLSRQEAHPSDDVNGHQSVVRSKKNNNSNKKKGKEMALFAATKDNCDLWGQGAIQCKLAAANMDMDKDQLGLLLSEEKGAKRLAAVGNALRGGGGGHQVGKLAGLFLNASSSTSSSTSDPTTTAATDLRTGMEYNKAFSTLMYNMWRSGGGAESLEKEIMDKEDGESRRGVDNQACSSSNTTAAAAVADLSSSEERMESQLRNWVNRLLNLKGSSRVSRLYSAVNDGLLLLRVLDTLSKGIVDWRKVEMNPTNQFKCISNNNYAVELATQVPFLFSLVGIAGVDLVRGNEKLTLALVWQLMRFQLFKNLDLLLSGKKNNHRSSIIGKSTGAGPSSSLPSSSSSSSSSSIKPTLTRPRTGSGNKRFNEKTLLEHANKAVHRAFKECKGAAWREIVDESSETRLSSFSDAHLANSHYMLVLLAWVIHPVSSSIPWKLVTAGRSADEKSDNAKLLISLARKHGATVYIMPRDVVELKTDMIVTLIAAILGLSVGKKRKRNL